MNSVGFRECVSLGENNQTLLRFRLHEEFRPKINVHL